MTTDIWGIIISIAGLAVTGLLAWRGARWSKTGTLEARNERFDRLHDVFASDSGDGVILILHAGTSTAFDVEYRIGDSVQREPFANLAKRVRLDELKDAVGSELRISWTVAEDPKRERRGTVIGLPL